MSEKPFVSFCITCYKQERYIRETLAGAFAQTYENMEIVISDDCSPDGTVDVIKREIDRYRAAGGKHRIVLNVNEKNLGNLGNWVKLNSIAKGELLVKNDGDDISLPERTAKLVDAWLKAGKKPDAVTSMACKFIGNGRVMELVRRPPFPLGCATAYTRRIYDMFGDVQMSNEIDDQVWAARLLLMRKAGTGGEELYVDEPLVWWRMGGLSNNRGVASIVRIFKFVAVGNPQMLLDMKKVQANLSPGVESELAALHEWKKTYYGHLVQLWTGKKFGERLEGYRATRCRTSPKQNLVRAMLLLPPWFRNPILNAAYKLVLLARFFKYRRVKLPPGLQAGVV